MTQVEYIALGLGLGIAVLVFFIGLAA